MTLEEFAREDMAMLRKLAARVDPPNIEELADMRLLDLAQRAMRDKLALARMKGRGGWWNEAECSIEHLRSLLREHVEKGDMRDVMNLAAMVFVREVADAQPNTEAQRAAEGGPTGAQS